MASSFCSSGVSWTTCTLSKLLLGLLLPKEKTGKVTPIMPCRPTEAAIAMVVGCRMTLRRLLRMGRVLVIISIGLLFGNVGVNKGVLYLKYS